MSDKPPDPSVEPLATAIREGIAQRGFHVAESDTLLALWGEAALTPVEKLMRVHGFAAAHNWNATGRDGCNQVLFQARRQGPVSEDSWRLDGDLRRALAGRFPGDREALPQKSGSCSTKSRSLGRSVL